MVLRPHLTRPYALRPISSWATTRRWNHLTRKPSGRSAAAGVAAAVATVLVRLAQELLLLRRRRQGERSSLVRSLLFIGEQGVGEAADDEGEALLAGSVVEVFGGGACA